jgi:hypothetical protein
VPSTGSDEIATFVCCFLPQPQVYWQTSGHTIIPCLSPPLVPEWNGSRAIRIMLILEII